VRGTQPRQLSLESVGDAGWPEPDPEQPRWTASAGFYGLLVGVVGALVLVAMTAAVFAIFGEGDLDNSPSFAFTATLAQDLALVAAALIVTAGIARPSARQFGFRRFGASALGWTALALVAYYSAALVYEVLANPPSDELPQEFGAERSTVLAVFTGIFVIGVAPVIEEFFFRGFLYQAFRSRFGVIGGAVLSGLIFGAIHFKPEYLVPLAVLGVVLALLFQKTGSLWPCILAHAMNNAIAFQYVMTH
jgi:CAAX protease family protein